MADKKTRITVSARQASRWRAGLHFTTEPVTIEVSDEQKARIEADPLLAVTVPAEAGKKA